MVDARFLKAYKYLIWTTLALIALGGGVRAMDAGLACPDWPLCFGAIIPDYHPQVYAEFLHRALAGLVAIATVSLNWFLIRSPKVSKGLKALCWFSLVLLMAQVVMGGLTVLLQLQAKIVTTHLALGTGFLATLLWIYFSVRPQGSTQERQTFAPSQGLKIMSLVALAAVYGQILLGGLVASNYAAHVCPSFPLCHGQWVPTLQGAIGLQVIHRLGAYTLTLIILALLVWVWRELRDKEDPLSREFKAWSRWLLVALLVQMGIGIANVLLFTPPLITVLHLTFGAVLLGLALRMVYMSWVTAQRECLAAVRVPPSEKPQFADSFPQSSPAKGSL